MFNIYVTNDNLNCKRNCTYFNKIKKVSFCDLIHIFYDGKTPSAAVFTKLCLRLLKAAVRVHRIFFKGHLLDFLFIF